MKFTGVVALSLVALASAQSPSASQTVELSPVASCAVRCPEADICCRAACAGVPCPDEAMVNKTTQCAAKCEQGNGSPADTEAYARCQAACISSYFFSGTAALPAETATAAPSNSANPTNTAGGSDGSSGTDGPTATGTSEPTGSSTSTATTTPNAAATLNGATAGTFFGLMLAAFAL